MLTRSAEPCALSHRRGLFASGAAARFTLADDGTISPQQLGEWADTPSETLLFEQAHGELEASLGRTPSL